MFRKGKFGDLELPHEHESLYDSRGTEKEARQRKDVDPHATYCISYG